MTTVRKTTLMDRIEVYADAGRVSAPLKLWKAQISRLKKKGFTVVVESPTHRHGEFKCTVSWDLPQGRSAELMLDATTRALLKK
jgi:muramoyltetrapeptide carboxypeptidase LdcA involved in peptidoglycan recycling